METERFMLRLPKEIKNRIRKIQKKMEMRVNISAFIQSATMKEILREEMRIESMRGRKAIIVEKSEIRNGNLKVI